MSHRVVQWTTGNVGRQSVAAIVAHPDLELVGCYAWSPDKVGTDVGDLCGIGPIGVARDRRCRRAPRTEAGLRRLQPDVVDVDDMVRILEAGSNIVSTAAFITGHSLGDGRRRIAEACERGGASVFGSGINPGFADLLALVTRRRVRPHRQGHGDRDGGLHGVRLPRHRAAGRVRAPHGRPEPAEMTTDGTAVFEDAVRLLGDALGVELDEVVCEAEYAATTEDLDLGSWQIAEGVRGRDRRQLARPGRRPDGRRAAGAVAEGPEPRSGLAARLGLPHRDRGPPDDPDQGRHPPAARTSRGPPSRTSWCSA